MATEHKKIPCEPNATRKRVQLCQLLSPELRPLTLQLLVVLKPRLASSGETLKLVFRTLSIISGSAFDLKSQKYPSKLPNNL